MSKARSMIFLLGLFCLPAFVRANSPPSILWNNFDYPLAVATFSSGISGNKIVGEYATTVNSIQVNHGFLFDGTAFQTLDDPSEFTAGNSTTNGIDGSNVVGWYGGATTTHGFLYDGSNWKQLDDPLATDGTFANAISGNKIVGVYHLTNDDFVHGFEYDTTTQSYSKLINPSFPMSGVYPNAISGNKIVGFYNGVSPPPGGTGFLFDGTTWTGLSDPQATGDTIAEGIDGNNIVGYFENASGYHGFLFDGTTWTTLDDPLAQQKAPFGTFVTGISGNNIVGWYLDSSNKFHGFVATMVPEPSAIVLAIFGTLLCGSKRLIKRLKGSRS